MARRACSLAQYVRWISPHSVGGSFLPVSEERVYAYISYLREEKLAPTRAAGLIETFNMASSLLGASALGRRGPAPRAAARRQTLERFIS